MDQTGKYLGIYCSMEIQQAERDKMANFFERSFCSDIGSISTVHVITRYLVGYFINVTSNFHYVFSNAAAQPFIQYKI